MGYLDKLYLSPYTTPPSGPVLPSGALFDFNPEESVTVDQAGSVAITNGGGYSATADALQKSSLSRVAMDGTNPFTAAWPSDLADYSAAMPFTVYCVVRSSEFDEGAYPFSVYAEADSSTNRILGQLVATNVRQNRQRIDSSAGVGFDDDVDTPFAPGTIQILSYEFNSLSQGRKSIDDTIGALQAYSNGTRDPNDLDTLEIGGFGSTGVWNGDYFRLLVYQAATDQDVLDYLAAVYLERPNAGADLTIPAGAAVFDFNPTIGGDFTAAVDSSGTRLAGTTQPSSRFPTLSRLDGGVHGGLSFDETVDEHLEFPSYPGAASLSACTDGKLCVYMVVDPLGSSADSLFAVGDANNSTAPSLSGTYNSSTGALVVNVDDDGNNIDSNSGGTGATSGTEVLAFFYEHDATNGMTIGAAAGAASMTTSQKASVTGDVDLDRLFLASEWRFQSISTFEGTIRRLLVVEGADYSTALAADILSSVTT